MADERRLTADLLCLAALAAAVVLFFADAVLRGGVFFVQDAMVQNVPFRHFFHRALAAGRLPLWEPLINCGFPLFAEGQVGALYPPNWLAAAFLFPAAAVTLTSIGHLWLAAAGTYLYLRALGCGVPAALTAGLGYGLSGYLVVRAMSPGFLAASAWLPFLFLLVEGALARGRPLRLWLAGGVLALQLVCGHPQAAFYGAFAALAYGAWRAWQLRRAAALPVAALVALGGGMAALQLLPTHELAELSLRGGAIGYDQFVNMSMPPERLLCLLLPDFFGNPATGSYWGREAGFFIQLCPYVGILTVVLALVAVREGRAPVRGFFTALAAAGLLLSLGHYTGLFHALHEVPVLRQFRIPTRFLLWWGFAAAVLAGLGLERLVETERPFARRWWPVWLGAAGLALVAVWLNGEVLWNTRSELAAASRELVRRYRADLQADLLRAGVSLAAAAVLVSTRFRRWRQAAAVAAAAVPALLWVDLFHFGGGFNSTLPPRVYQQVPASARTVVDDAAHRWVDAGAGVPPSGRYRVASAVSEQTGRYDWHSGWARDPSSYEGYPETLRMYTAGLYGLAGVLPGWSPLHLRRHWEFATGHPGLLTLANTGYIITDRPIDSAEVELVQAGGVRVYRLLHPLPRAYVVPEAVVIADDRQRLSYLRHEAFDPRRQVVLDRSAEDRAPAVGPGFAPARITRYEPTQVVVDLPGLDGYLVLSDTHAPGWRALVDGQPRQILLANHVFRAVPVSAADQRVEFGYEPGSVMAGAWVSGVCAALWITAGLALRRRRWPPACAATDRAPSLVPAVLQAALVVLLYGVVREGSLWAAAADRMRLLAALGAD